MATWRYRVRVTVHAPAAKIAARLPAGVPVESIDANTCVLEAGSDSPQMLALHLGMLDADFSFDESSAPELAEYFRTLANRWRAESTTIHNGGKISKGAE